MSIQCDWPDVLRKINGECWISCKFHDKPSLYGKIKIESITNNAIPRASASEGFEVKYLKTLTLGLRHSETGYTCIFVAPFKIFSEIHKKSVVCLDVTPGELGVSVSAENKLHLWDSNLGITRRNLEGHIGDVYKCRFFPSGIVFVTGGADMQLKIWSAETGQCPVTLRGHTAAVMDICIVDRGRNIVSVSKDGLAKLWDCGQSSCLRDLVDTSVTINCCCLTSLGKEYNLGEPEEPSSEREIGTSGKVLLYGCEDGTVGGVALRSHNSIFHFSLKSAVNCITVLVYDKFIVGCQNGQIFLFSLHQHSEPLMAWFESNSPLLSVLSYKGEGFFCGRADGSCVYYPFSDSDDAKYVRVQLTGPDYDPVYDIACDGKFIFTACRDSVIRKYELAKVTDALQIDI
uniref:Proteasomal ATPase-associated factor 1 n=1 Tax=Timema cristinae TaxID=61476 RepID=A0A7R9H4Z0_TIMCR|nr:unnamed protein product [Timema cristinae]